MEGYIEIEKYRKLEAELEQLKFQMEQLKRMVFGTKSERFISDQSPEQLNLFGEQTPATTPTKVKVEAHEKRVGKQLKKPKRLPLPQHLERKEEVLEPEVDLAEMVKIGEERTEMLVYTPAELHVKVVVRPKYAPKTSSKAVNTSKGACKIHIAPMPSRFIEKCVADETLLAAISVDKFVDHLPLYRIIGRFDRLEVSIPRSTMSGWIAQSAHRLVPLYNKLCELVLASNYLQVDETRIEVQINAPPIRKKGKRKKGKTHRGYYWGYLARL